MGDAKAAEQARSFWGIMLAFAAGALVGAFATRSLGDSAAWIAAALVTAALSLFVIDESAMARRWLGGA
jgi:uncharacterized membrane protein YoaK (UPF0700 family)